jgi:phosphoserine phosphatase RsbU/P
MAEQRLCRLAHRQGVQSHRHRTNWRCLMPESSQSGPRLQVIDSLGRRLVIVDKPVFRIGRRHDNDLHVESGDVSREHAEIVHDPAGWYVLRDRGSRCGTFVNDEPVTDRTLSHGDRIRLGRSGSAELVFLLEGAADSASSHASAIIDFRRITSLLDSLRSMGSARVLDDVLALVMDTAIEATGAERGFIMLANPAGELEFKIARARSRTTLSGRSFETSQKIPQQVFTSGREQVVSDLRDRDLASEHLGTVAMGIRHVLCTPLRVVRYLERSDSAPDQRPIGVLYLDGHEKGTLLSSQARAALETVATEAASAIESTRLYREATEKRRLERELQLAAEIQRALLPEARLSGPHFEVAAASLPCRAIGGDFFDYFPLPDGTFGFALGDVAGKGPSAALLAAMIQGSFAAHVTTAVSPAALMTHVNQTLIRRSLESRFATVIYAALAVDGRLTYSNAGHNPPVLLSRSGVRRLDTGGLILGLFPQAAYEEETLALEQDDLLVVFSDGVTEALNAQGEEFDEGRLLACLDAHRQSAPAELLECLLSTVRTFVASAAQSDDVTALVLRYRGRPDLR